MDGWCHGQAGHVFLHLLANQVLSVFQIRPDHDLNLMQPGQYSTASIPEFPVT
jgi:hypothetical protein